MNAFDELVDFGGPVSEQLKQEIASPPLPGEFPAQTVQRKQTQNRLKAEDLASRDIPYFRNASGDVSPVTDETGQALTHFDPSHNIAYDSAGNPKAVSYDSPEGPPTLKDPFADLPVQTDIKTGDQYQVRPGLAPKWVGTDAQVAATAQQAESDKALTKERNLLGRQLTLDEADHKKMQATHKALGADLTTQVPTLADPAFADADLPTVKKAIDDHYNTLYAAPEANTSVGWFSKDLSPEAQARRTQLDTEKAQAYDKAQKLFDLRERGSALADRIDESRARASLENQQLLAHARGEQGPLDIPPPEEQAPPPQEVTGHVETDKAISDAKAGNKPYLIDDKDTVQFKPDNLTGGLDQAVKDGIIDSKWAEEHRAKFKEAEQKYTELQKAAGNAQVLKALLHGAGIGSAFLAGAAPGAKAGALVGAAVPGAGETGLSEAIGAAIGGLATGTIAAFYARKGLQKLAEYSDAVKSLTASAELHPVASGAGELIAFGASAPKALSNLYKLGTIAGEAVSDLGPEAARTAALKVVGRQLGIGAVSGVAFEGAIRPAFDAARYAAADALGIEHDKFQKPDAKSLLTMAALGVLTAGHSIEFADYSAKDVASIMSRAKVRQDAGIDLGADNPAGVVNAFQKRGVKLDSQAAQAMSQPLTPQEISVWNALKEKTARMERSGAFDEAGVKFTGATQARVRTLGREGEPIVSAGVEAVPNKPVEGEGPAPKGPTPELPGGPKPKGGEPVNETGNKRPITQKQPIEGQPVPEPESPAKPADQTGKGAQPISPNAGVETAGGRGGKSELLATPEGSTPSDPRPDWLKENHAKLAAIAERAGTANKIEELHAQRFTADEIAKQLNVDTQVVRAVRAERRLPERTESMNIGLAGGGQGAPENPEFTKWVNERTAKNVATGQEQSQATAGEKRPTPATQPEGATPPATTQQGEAAPGDTGLAGAQQRSLPVVGGRTRIKSPEESRVGAEVARGVHAPVISQLGLQHRERPLPKNRSGIALERDGSGISYDHDQVSKAAALVHWAGGDSQQWLNDAHDEEITHHRDLLVSGHQFDQIHKRIWNEMGPHVRNLVQHAYPDTKDESSLAAEYIRMVDQFRRTGRITEQHFRKDLGDITEELGRVQSPTLETHLKQMTGLTTKEGESNAPQTGKQQSNKKGELPRVPTRPDVPAHQGEIRKGESQQAVSGGGVGERPPTPAPEQGAPRSSGQPARPETPKSQLDDKTKAAMKKTFEGLFAAMPTKHLVGKEKAAVVMLKKGKSIGEVAKMFVMKPEQVEAAYDKSLSALPALGAARPYGNVPDALMGFPRIGPTKPFEDQRYGHIQSVRVTFDDNTSIEDAVKGLNQSHALERARRNWPGAKIEPISTLGAASPRLRSGEKQGDIFSAQTEDLTLAGETGIDWEARKKDAAKAEADKIAGQKISDEAQGSLFSGKPSPSTQRAIPPDKLGQFVQLAQQLIAAGIDSPEKLANEIDANLSDKARPFSQALWDAIGMVRPDLRGTHNWDQIYRRGVPTPTEQPAPAKPRKLRAPRPDGGFAEHPFIQAIMGKFGGILSKSAYKAKFGKEKFEANRSMWDDAPALADPSHNKIYDPRSGQTPDAVAQGLADMGLLRDGDVPAMWREIQKISESSKRIEQQERVQNKEAAEWTKRAEAEPEPESNDPWSDILPGTPNADIIPVDDRSSRTDLESDSGQPGTGESGGESGVQTGPGTTGGSGQISDDPFRGSSDPAESGPLSDDVPAAPHREPSGEQLREPASDLPERAPGSEQRPRSGGTGDTGLPANTDGAKLDGENLVQSGDSGSLAGVRGSGGSELADIKRAAPALTPEQVEDVRFIEARLFEQGKPGVLITNGTGTGKTFSGLGAVKRMLDRGAKHILVPVPSDKIGSDWVTTAKQFFGIDDIAQLASTVDNGKGRRVVVTTYANFGQNDSLVKRPWDAVVADESHHLSSAEGGESTLALDALRALTWHPQGIHRRVAMLEPEAHDRLRALRELERRLHKDRQNLTQTQQEEIHEQQAKLDAREKEVRAELMAKAGSNRPKVLFMSATPFAYRKSVDYGNGYLFDYPEVTDRGYNTPSPFGQFMVENFGYRMRYGKLTEPENAIATGILERRFAERLMREGAMRGRALVVPFDYSRDFILTESQLGAKIDDILKTMMDDPRLRVLEGKIGVSDYLQRRFILESLKAKEAIPRIRKHIALGRKVLVHHDYKLGGAGNPLYANIHPGESKEITIDNRRERIYLEEAFARLRAKFPDWNETAAQLTGLRSPIQQFTEAFGGEEGLLGIFNGSVPKKQRRELITKFNERGGKMKIMLAQRASSKEGISLHDIHGIPGEQRARTDLGLPSRPTDSTQCEGRLYRVGVKSNAIQEYLNTGTNWERWTFAQTIAQRASTAENLAMGEGARALLNAFAQGFNDSSVMEPHVGQGVGGKADDEVRERGDPYDNAIALYYTNEKKTSRSKSREGIDYFATPEPLGFKMVEWTALQPGEKFLEPSAGHGAIARFAPDAVTRHAVEPSNELAGRLALNAPDTEIHNQRFEDFNIINKFDGITTNPPYGTAGKTAMEHLEKDAKHLKDGGRLVALIPRGKMDERFDEWLASEAGTFLHLRAEIKLPAVTFARAGTSLIGRVVVIDKSQDLETVLTGRQHDLSDVTDIKDLFERLRHLSVPARPEKKIAEPEPEPEKQPAVTGGGSYQPSAEKQPLSPTLPQPDKDSTFTPTEFKHTKTGADVFVARTARYMSKPEFSAARERAKEFGGYYSSFKGAGAVPGFHFKTAEARDAFIGVNGQPPTTLGAAVPIVGDYYKQDVEPVLKSAKTSMREIKAAAVHLFSPTTGVATPATDAAFRMLGGRNKAAYKVDRALVAAEKMFDRMPRTEQIGFIDRMKRGEEQPTPELQQIAETMRDIDTNSWKAARAAYRALGFENDEIPLSWLENHYRVMWKTIPGSDVERKGVPGKGKSPLRGSRGMQRMHTLEDMSEGLDQGGIPFSYNPVTMFKMAQGDIWKLTTALHMWAWGKDNDFVKFVKGKFAKVPDGMTWLNDQISRVYFPTPQGIVEPGRYAVEEGWGRILNNYLSRDYIRATQAGRSLLWIKNATTSLELSLSLFHGVFETLEAVGSNIGLGLSKLVNRGVLGGDVKAILDGFKDMITAPASPLTGNSLGVQIRKAAGDPDKFFATPEGQNLLKVYPRAREMIEDLFTGGWKPTELDQDWKNNSIRSFIDAIGDIKAGNSSNYLGAGLRAFPAANEFLMKPLFDYYIPNLKLAQFFREYDEALKQNERKLQGGILTRAALARQVWRFVEDRFGEMNFDTLFWNNNFKTAMQLMFRSVTWKLGSVEAFAGAFGGQGREFINAMRERRAPELHRNMAWLFGMFLLTATLGTIISKTLGKKDPKDLTDVVFPQIDEKDPHVRVSIPTYFKDMVHLIHSPTGYVTSSLSGWIGRVADLLKNKDYYGVQIRNTDDPVVKQALQVGKYTGETMLPFSIRGYKNLSAAQVDSTRKLLATAGVVPAPRYIGQTPAERKASDIMKGQQTEEGITPEQFETRMEKKRLVSELTHGRPADIGGAIRTGALKPKEVKELFKRAHMTPLAYSISHMPLASAERVYAAASPKEKADLAGLISRKRASAAARQGRTQFSGF